jgi:hypothetical protein
MTQGCEVQAALPPPHSRVWIILGGCLVNGPPFLTSNARTVTLIGTALESTG